MSEHLLIANGNGKGGVDKTSIAADLAPSSTHPIRRQIKALVSKAIVE